jgi:Fic family protein
MSKAFVDVNKRTARLCANIPLITQNFAPLSFNEIKKNDYISAIISLYELSNINPLLDLFTSSYLRT